MATKIPGDAQRMTGFENVTRNEKARPCFGSSFVPWATSVGSGGNGAACRTAYTAARSNSW